MYSGGACSRCASFECRYVVAARPGWSLMLQLVDFELTNPSDTVEIHSRTIDDTRSGNQLVSTMVAKWVPAPFPCSNTHL